MNTTETLTDSILNLLSKGDTYIIGGAAQRGQAISFLAQQLRNDGWKGLGGAGDFETRVKSLGFSVLTGKNSRGQSARVVTL